MGVKLLEVLKADGVSHHGWMIFCPACKQAHEFDERWTYNGKPEAPTFRNSMLVYGWVSPDPVKYPGAPRCHSYVTDGNIEFLSDCDHEMKGTTVRLPDWDATKGMWG